LPPSSFEQRFACVAEPGIKHDLARWSARSVPHSDFAKSWKKGGTFHLAWPRVLPASCSLSRL
jgi:hypothetical protein